MDELLERLKQQYLMEPTLENQRKYVESLIRSGSFYSYSEDQIIKDYAKKTHPQPIHRKPFPIHYRGYLLVEMDETEYWNADLVLKTGYIGGVYLIDLNTNVYLAQLSPSYAAYPLYPTSMLEHPKNEELIETIEMSWIEAANSVDYYSMSSLQHAVDWRTIGDLDLFGFDMDLTEEDLVEQLINYFRANRML